MKSASFVAFVGVIVVGCSLAAPTNSPMVPSPNPSPTNTHLASPAHTDEPTPTLERDVTPSPTATSALPTPLQPIVTGRLGTSDWIVLGTGEFSIVSRSPDDAYFLVRRGRDRHAVELSRGDGSFVRSYSDVDWAAWLDAEQFLLVTYGEPDERGDRSSIAAITTVDSDVVTPTDVPMGFGLSNQRGAVAFVERNYRYGRGCEPWGCPDPAFTVWTRDGASERHSGRPIAWTPDGSRLLVLNVDDGLSLPIGAPAAPDTIGWVEVLSWPDMASVHKHRDVRVVDNYWTLDPTGQFLAWETFRRGIRHFINVLDIESGESNAFRSEGATFAWATEGRLYASPPTRDAAPAYDQSGQVIYLATPRLDAIVHDWSGRMVGTVEDVGQLVASSADGSIVYYSDEGFSDARSFVTAVSATATEEVEPLPADGYLVSCGLPSVGGDGSLIVSCWFNDRAGQVGVSALLFHPRR